MDILWKKYRRLIKTGIILCAIVLLYGIIEVVSIFQETKRDATASENVNLQEYTTSFKAYDVEGLTDEEIDEYLEKAREYYRQQQEGE